MVPFAAILVGGRGSRLKPVWQGPKALAPVHGRPFLEFVLDSLVASGAGKIVLCTGEQGAEIQQRIGTNFRGTTISYSVEPQPLGTAGALRRACVDSGEGEVLVLNGDTLCEVDYPDLLRTHHRLGARATLTLASCGEGSRFGSVRFDASGAVTAFVEKASQSSGWVSAGVYVLSREVLELIPGDRPVSLETEVFPGWIGRGLFGYKCPGRFIDIGTPESYAEAERILGPEF